MKPQEIAWRRLAGQLLTVAGPPEPKDVVQRLGAVQAQDYDGARWAVAQRTKTLVTRAMVDRAVDTGAIVRTHAFRLTWHFVLPEDLRWMLALVGPRLSRALAAYNRRLELTPALIRRSHAVLAKALAGGRCRTRAELAAVLARAKVGVFAGQRLTHLVAQAELDAVVCSGPRRGKQSTYALFDERVPAGRVLDRDAALGETARRYFPTRGPATVHDFSWWAGLTVADARRAVEVAGRALDRVDIGGTAHWMGADAPAAPKRPRAHLLPNYDEYFIGLVDRGAIGQRVGSVAQVTGGNALVSHVAIVNGQIVGGWKLVPAATGLTLRVGPLARLSRAERSLLVREVARYREFAAEPVQVVGMSAPARPAAAR